MELKTFDEIINDNSLITRGEYIVGLQNRGIFRDEAIKDIKELEAFEKVCNEVSRTGEVTEEQKKRFGKLADGIWTQMDVIDYIKWKNNITKDDLK